MGADIYYLPRENWDETDMLFGENVKSKFERAYQMEMYLPNVNGWEGEGEFFSKFGLEIRQGMNFIVAKRTFEKYVPNSIAIRPREGDLIYVPTMQQIFEIKFVEEELLFFTLGKKYPYIYELRCEVFRYANETLGTGIDIIDSIENDSTYTVTLHLTGTGNYHKGEVVYQGVDLLNATAKAQVSNWNPTDKTLQVININKQFVSGANIIGVTSNTSMLVANTDTLGDAVFYDQFDNKLIQNEANTFVDLTEINVFGKP